MTMAPTVTLRRLPANCRAMLAIANDVDEATWDEFVTLHQFLNTTSETPLGPGLGLDVADSFFFFATTAPVKRPTFAYYESDRPDVRAPWADAMEALIDAGYLDSLHSWGEFSRTGGFQRALAEQAARVLAVHPVPVWINHGDRMNEQQVGRDGWDDPRAPHGHADITLGAGLRYFWTGALTAVVGQERPLPWTWDGLIDGTVRPAVRSWRGHGLVHQFGNHIMRPVSIGQHTAQVFQRYGDWRRPTATELGDVLTEDTLDQLEAVGGVMIVYTHLFRRRAGSLQEVDWSPLVRLAARARAERLLVTTTSRLLRYVEARAAVAWRVVTEGDTMVVHLESLPVAADAAGLTFDITGRTVVGDVRVVWQGRDLPTTRQVLPDGGARVHVPWSPLGFPAELVRAASGRCA